MITQLEVQQVELKHPPVRTENGPAQQHPLKQRLKEIFWICTLDYGETTSTGESRSRRRTEH
jgi:hypothetical protein